MVHNQRSERNPDCQTPDGKFRVSTEGSDDICEGLGRGYDYRDSVPPNMRKHHECRGCTPESKPYDGEPNGPPILIDWSASNTFPGLIHAPESQTRLWHP